VTLIIWVFVTIAALYAAYRAIHYFVPTWGTILTNLITLIAAFFDAISALPWDTLTGGAKVQGAVLMGASVANMLIRVSGPKGPVKGIG
jgi:hypothetical protein